MQFQVIHSEWNAPRQVSVRGKQGFDSETIIVNLRPYLWYSSEEGIGNGSSNVIRKRCKVVRKKRLIPVMNSSSSMILEIAQPSARVIAVGIQTTHPTAVDSDTRCFACGKIGHWACVQEQERSNGADWWWGRNAVRKPWSTTYMLCLLRAVTLSQLRSASCP